MCTARGAHQLGNRNSVLILVIDLLGFDNGEGDKFTRVQIGFA